VKRRRSNRLPTARLIGCLFVVLTTLPLALLTAFAVHVTSDALQSEVEARVASTAAAGSVAIHNEVKGLRDLVESYAERSTLAGALSDPPRYDRDLLRAILQEAKQASPGIATAFVASPTGRLIEVVPATPSIRGKDYSFRDWYRGVVVSGRSYVSEAYESQATGSPQVIAVATFAETQGVSLSVTDQRGVLLAAPRTSAGTPVSVASDPLVSAALRGESGISTQQTVSGSALTAYQPVGGLNWTIRASAPNAHALSAVSGLRNMLLSAAAFLGVALVGGLMVLARLLRDRRRIERQLHEAKEEAEMAREEAERAKRAKSEFLSRMSHELRTPLNAVLGFGQLLEMDGLDREQLESVQQILKGGRHLLDLIDEVLDIARIETGRISLSPEPVQLSEALLGAVELVRPIARGRGIQIEVSELDSTESFVLADRQRLRQVLLNLLSNAVKYNREAGRVVVRTEEAGPEGVRISVTDEGAGIPTEKMDRLFTPFDRLGAEGSGVEGTGLGLALSKRLVEAMAGSLTVQSETGRGSTFSVLLPRASRPSLQPEEIGLEADAFSAFVGGGHVVLQIEDNPANLRLVERALKSLTDVKVISAPQGRLGVELAGQHRPDVILLDVNLPDISGLEVLRALRAEPATRDIPVIVISADATRQQITRLLDAGALAYITKPLDVTRFVQIVGDALHERRLDRAQR
jgi:signal transduction histidine kinase/ActR/RegA family two-component response regulator